MTTTDDRHPELACPSCGLYATHAMREPRQIPAVDPEAWTAYTDALQAKIDEAVAAGLMSHGEAMIRFFPGEKEEVTGVPVPLPTSLVTDPSEAMFTTIRVCECGQEWGQA